LYSSNIAGAVVGSLLAGFYLLRVFDTHAATYAASTINLTIAVISLLLARSATFEHRAESPPRLSPIRPPSPIRLPSPVLLATALSGCCALAAETIWTRVLSLVFGASVYTFSIVVAIFLSGLSIGSGVGSFLCRTLSRPRVALGCCQVLAGAAI